MRIRQIRRVAAAAGIAAALVTTAAACASDGSDAASSGATTTTAATGNDQTARPDDVNDADIEFVQGMIPHHQQAIEMSEMVIDNGDDPDVIALAEQIEAAQGPEIDQMQTWLDDWGVEPDDMSDMSGMSGSDSMGDGMMSGDEMDAMSAMTGTGLDQMFLEMMIRHHEGAIEMAQVEIEDGSNPDVVALARTIIETQQAEISKMRSMTEDT